MYLVKISNEYLNYIEHSNLDYPLYGEGICINYYGSYYFIPIVKNKLYDYKITQTYGLLIKKYLPIHKNSIVEFIKSSNITLIKNLNISLHKIISLLENNISINQDYYRLSFALNEIFYSNYYLNVDLNFKGNYDALLASILLFDNIVLTVLDIDKILSHQYRYTIFDYIVIRNCDVLSFLIKTLYYSINETYYNSLCEKLGHTSSIKPKKLNLIFREIFLYEIDKYNQICRIILNLVDRDTNNYDILIAYIISNKILLSSDLPLWKINDVNDVKNIIIDFYNDDLSFDNYCTNLIDRIKI